VLSNASRWQVPLTCSRSKCKISQDLAVRVFVDKAPRLHMTTPGVESDSDVLRSDSVV
jgi:hypothetical protein